LEGSTNNIFFVCLIKLFDLNNRKIIYGFLRSDVPTVGSLIFSRFAVFILGAGAVVVVVADGTFSFSGSFVVESCEVPIGFGISAVVYGGGVGTFFASLNPCL
jgi:hypothetical protein